MNKFEKIKTIADKRIAATKRGKLVANDFQAGDSLFITEKVDGHNASFSSEGDAFSREQLIDPKTNAPLVPFSEFVSQLSFFISNNDSLVEDESYEVEIEELKSKIDCLNDVIARLERNNKRLEDDVEKYKKDYLYYFNEYLKLKDKDFKRNLDEMDQLKKNSLMHNARGAGRKAKFTDDQVDEIRRLREDGNTIKEIAKRYNCSVGLIHKLINEK